MAEPPYHTKPSCHVLCCAYRRTTFKKDIPVVARIKMTGLIAEDRQTMTLTMLDNNVPLATAVIGAPELEDLIQLLSAFRTQLADQAPTDIEFSAKVQPFYDSAWRTRLSSSSPGVELVLRHPGLGWMVNLLPKHEAAALGQSLLEVSKQA